ncbi:hypothetical protein ACA910_006714 [Epithemia clementina (nom. ined.)]
MVPYLKGLHLTLESWREDRDEDGWKMTPRERALVNRGDDEKRDVVGDNYNPNLKPPDMVVPAPRFKDDVLVLFELTKASHPPRILVRPTGQAIAALMFGDASGTGFGTSLWLQGSSEVHAEHGIWTKAYGARSSNFCELYNLVSRIESLSKEGTIQEVTELCEFTDNSTMESAFYKGTLTSKLLFDLVVRLKKLEMSGQLFLNVIWVAGTRMIEQGMDGLSRGDLMNGVLTGCNMLQYVPLNKSCEEQQPGLVNQFLVVTHKHYNFIPLIPTDWFEKALTQGDFVWTPPPAAADAVVEKLCKSKHIQPLSTHSRWRKKLGRIADVVFAIPVGTTYWTTE